MNYNDLQWAVWLTSPCPFRIIPVGISPSEYPSGTLLLILDSDEESALAIFNDNNVRVSAKEVSELVALAQGHRKGERSVNEIKVGDKVRVVQIIVRERTAPSAARHIRLLGKEGTVTFIGTGLFYKYGTLLSGETISYYFNREELKVLSAPCEQQESKIFSPRFKWYAANREIRILTRSNARLIKEKELLGVENDRLATRLLDQLGISRRLQEKVTGLQSANDQMLTTLAELQERYNDVLLADERVPCLRDALAGQIKVSEELRESLAGKRVFIGRLQKRGRELREQYDNLLRTSASARAEIRVILNRSPHISQG